MENPYESNFRLIIVYFRVSEYLGVLRYFIWFQSISDYNSDEPIHIINIAIQSTGIVNDEDIAQQFQSFCKDKVSGPHSTSDFHLYWVFSSPVQKYR